MPEYRTVIRVGYALFDEEVNRLAQAGFKMLPETFEHSLEISCVMVRERPVEEE